MTSTPDRSASGTWQLRTQLEVLSDQLRGIDAWNAGNAARATAERATAMTREMRLDVSRRMLARCQEQQALLERARQHMAASARLLAEPVQPRAVVVHRNAWLCGKVAQGLRDGGVQVVAVLADGAQAAGTLVVEQPEILLLEDRLPTLTGLEVLERVRRFCPHTVTAAQLLDGQHAEEFRRAGARDVFTRRVPPKEIVEKLLACLPDRAAAVG